MKTVTAKIISSTPISVQKAAKIISNFASTDNGSSQAISAYLRRASTSFNELKQLHRELQKPSRSGSKNKKSKSETTVDCESEIRIEERESKREKEKNEGNFGEDEGKTVTEQSVVKKHKKEKRGRKIENLDENGVHIEKGEMGDEGEREGEKKTKKKRKSRDIEEGTEDNASSEPRKKKKIKN